MLRSQLFLIFLVGFTIISFGCSKNGAKTSASPDQTVQKTSTSDALQIFAAKQSFWSSVRKTVFRENRFYSLVFEKDSPNANVKIKSSLVVHSAEGNEAVFLPLPSNVTLIDFDITPNSQVVQLGITEVEGSESEFGFPLKELSVFVDSKKLFTFLDSKQSLAVRYDKSGNPAPAQQYDSNKTYFLTSSPMTEFAKLRVTKQDIFISAVGAFGFKVFRFDYSGREISQVEIVPQTDFNTVLLDKDAPYIEIAGSSITTAITISNDDAPIFKKHFEIPLEWNGPEYQVLLQSFNLTLSGRTARLIQGAANFFVAGIKAGENEIAIFGSSGGPGNRKAMVAAVDSRLAELYRAEFTLANESGLYAAAFSNGRWIVAGSTGSSQVQSGSVVEPADMFVSAISPDGIATTISRFGTDRNDGVTSLLAVGKDIFLSGQHDGPITHTADSDPNLGYQKWFLGKLRH